MSWSMTKGFAICSARAYPDSASHQSHKPVLTMPTGEWQMSTTLADFQLVELKPLGGLEGMLPRAAQGIDPR